MIQLEGQMTIFDFLGELSAQKEEKSFDPLYEFAKRGSGFANGKRRILDFFAENTNRKERAHFLKKEYGLGGFGFPVSDKSRYQLTGGDTATPMAKGKIRLEWHVPGKNAPDEELFSFEQLCDAICKCIQNGDY